MTRSTTVVNYYGSRSDSRCLYCPNSCSRYGLWAYCMAAADCQDLIDRGWRRLGQFCYKPNNKETCCPCYTIKCDAKDFNFTKSHKKILKKMNKFLENGEKCENDNSSNDENNSDRISSSDSADECNNGDVKNQEDKQQAESEETSASAEIKMITANPKIPIDIDDVLKLIEQVDNDNEQSPNNVDSTRNSGVITPEEPATVKSNAVDGNAKKHEEHENKQLKPDPNKPVLKAKELRMLRKAEKLAAKGLSNVEVTAVKKVPKNTEKNLTSFINEMPIDGKHRLKLNLINIESTEFECNKDIEFDLYARYQTKVHNDPPADRSEFNDFLCRSPIKHETPEDGPKCGYGTFHQQYWLDDTLVAVGVMDIMPRGISSVYFFYDPEFSFLTLGTYGTLREIEFIQEMNKKCPDLRGYYIGFYIPSVPKMLYKGKLQPSYLLCPEKYTWHLLDDDLVKLLEKSKYARFNPDPQAKAVSEFDPQTDLKHLRILVDNKKCLTFNDYKEYKHSDKQDKNDEDVENFSEYGQVVGKVVSRHTYLVI